MTAAHALGFADIPYDLSDKPVRELVYLHRVHEGQHQYLSLCHCEGRFLEAVVEVFLVPRNGKAKWQRKLADRQRKGSTPLYANIARDWESIVAAVGETKTS